ncbi:MAG: catabolite control protein A [Lachnospiraceae bacterium]|nr:catabolite control protein A [Lachnospiraceae bacterium]
MKRKTVNMVFVMAGVVLSLASCKNAQSTAVGQQDVDNIVEAADAKSDKNQDIGIKGFSRDGIIEETVMVDESDIKITATDLCYTDYAVQLNLTIENNSDKDLSFVSGSMGYSCNAINGYMLPSGYMNADVLAGKKTNETIRFRIDELSIYGITEIADIQIGFNVSDDDYQTVYRGVGQVKTSEADSYDYETDTFAENLKSGVLEKMVDCKVDYYSDDELYNQNGISIISEALVTNKDGEKTVFIEIENKSSELVYGVTSGMTINGLVVYSANWSSDAVSPQTRCVVGLTPSDMLDEDYWDLFGISEIENIAFSFVITDEEWNEVASSQEVSIALAKKTHPIDDKGKEVYNENGIRIIAKGLIEDSSDYSNDIHMLFLIENNYSDTIVIDDVYNSLSINGYMVDYMAGSRKFPSGKCALIDVEIDKSSLEECGIAGKEGIAEAEITFEIKDGKHNDIAEPTVLIEY